MLDLFAFLLNMNSSGQFNSHVFIAELDAWKLECNPIWDRLLGSILIMCTLIGAPANVLALRYFWSKRNKDLPTLLYILICCIDICTSITHLAWFKQVVCFRAKFKLFLGLGKLC